ncbi:MAG: IPT/TIG domain-containing protein [Porphyromonadaceae bacterium]|nr:IPT/TIG domain-containing protein [Porphyromonadaceae bacterium]
MEIIEVSPESGQAGTEITIEGTGFSGTAEDNKVTFNGPPGIPPRRSDDNHQGLDIP